jgi:hypothetical protein
MHETYRVVIPDSVAAGRYRVGLGVAQRGFEGGQGRIAAADRPELRDPGSLLQLGWIRVR